MADGAAEERAVKRLKAEAGQLAVQTALAEAAGKGWLRLLDRALEMGADPNRPHRQLAPLNLASAMGKKEHPEAVERLLAAGADPNRPRVITLCGVECLPLLVRAGGNSNGTSPADRPLVHAIVQRSKPDKALALLRSGANPNLPDEDGRLPLLLAARNGQVDIIRAALEAGADRFATTPDGRSALRLAAEAATGLGRAFSIASQKGARAAVDLLSAGDLPTNPEDLVLAVLARDDVREFRRLIATRVLASDARLAGAMGTGVHPDPLRLLRGNEAAADNPVDLVTLLLGLLSEANPSTGVLAWAVGLDARRCCAELLRLGADPRQPEPSGASPLDIARRLRRRQVLKLFERHSSI